MKDHIEATMTYRSFACLSCILAIILAGCNGLLSDTETPVPPGSAPYTTNQNENIDPLLNDFDHTIRGLLTHQHYKVMDPQMFTTTLAISDVITFYTNEMTKRAWQPASNNLPSDTSQALLAYEKRRRLLVVAALDTKKYHGPGVIIYTLQATK